MKTDRRNRHEYEEYPLPRGTLTELVLNVLSRGTEMTETLFNSVGKEVTNFSMHLQYHGSLISSRIDFAASYREAKNFSALLSKLKRDGFVLSAGAPRKFIWRITRGGRKKLAELRQRNAWHRARRTFATYWKALREEHILSCVHMIEVGKSGTIRQLS